MPDKLAWDASPKVLPDENGNYPIPMPGVFRRISAVCTPSMTPSSPSPLRRAAAAGDRASSAARTCGLAWKVVSGPTRWSRWPRCPRRRPCPAGFGWPALLRRPLRTLYLWPGNRSYTGQPVAEVHTLGSPPLLDAVVRAACSGGARPAEPGEFTLRAFLAGRIDLTQAEAVLGVIDATGPAELDAALEQLAGGLAGPLRRLRERPLGIAGPPGGRAGFRRRGPAVHRARTNSSANSIGPPRKSIGSSRNWPFAARRPCGSAWCSSVGRMRARAASSTP